MAEGGDAPPPRDAYQVMMSSSKTLPTKRKNTALDTAAAAPKLECSGAAGKGNCL